MKKLTEIEDKVYQIHRACSNFAFSNGRKEYQLRRLKLRNQLKISSLEAKEAVDKLISLGLISKKNGCIYNCIELNSTFQQLIESLQIENKILKARLEKAKEVYYQMKKKIDTLQECLKNKNNV